MKLSTVGIRLIFVSILFFNVGNICLASTITVDSTAKTEQCEKCQRGSNVDANGCKCNCKFEKTDDLTGEIQPACNCGIRTEDIPSLPTCKSGNNNESCICQRLEGCGCGAQLMQMLEICSISSETPDLKCIYSKKELADENSACDKCFCWSDQ